jgi:plastocyanin/mono/diheme cytochrome c family protein
MTDQPGQRPEERLPVPRAPSEVAPSSEVAPPSEVAPSTERFTAHPSAHKSGLSPERAAKIVTQSASARWVAFLAVSIVALFVIGYYFYDLGVPGVANSSRLEKEVAVQQVTDVTAGYKLFEANCARCHGAQGQGGIGPVLNDQAKLLTHLTPKYLTTVLTVGGRYVCGDAASLMPAWLEPNGPLNYRDVEELVAFVRAPSTLAYDGIDPATGLTTMLKGWRDSTFAPASNATPVPNCWKDAFASPSAAPSAGASGAPSAAPSGAPSGSPAASPAASGGATGTVLELTASGIAFDKADLTAPAGVPFQIKFTNNDAGIPHDVAIHKGSPAGEVVWQGEIFSGTDTRTYDVPALPAGTYGFSCTVHPNMTGTLTVK